MTVGASSCSRPRSLQALGQDGGAAGGVQVGGDEAPARLEVAQARAWTRRSGRSRRCPAARRHLARDGEQVQDAVGRAAGGGDGEDRVLERLAGDQVARLLASSEDVHHELAGGVGDGRTWSRPGRDEARADRADAHHLEGHRHRVGRVLAAAGARAGAGRGLDVRQVLVGDLARRVRADGLEDVHDRDVLALVVAGRDRAAVEHHAGDVEPRERHHGAGDRLVARAQADHGVEEVAERDQLDAVGDDLAARRGSSSSRSCPS